MIDTTLQGDWLKASTTLLKVSTRLMPAAQQLIQRGAQQLRTKLIQGLDSQSPGGRPFRPLSPMTLAKRRLTNRGGDKALIEKGDLRGAITVQTRRDVTFIGVPRKAKTARTRGAGGRFIAGKPLIDVARVHEFGARFTIRPTPKMRRFLAILAQHAGLPNTGSGGGGPIVVTIPARPWLRPTVAQWRPQFERTFRLEMFKLFLFGSSQRTLNLPAHQLKLPFGGS